MYIAIFYQQINFTSIQVPCTLYYKITEFISPWISQQVMHDNVKFS